MVHKYPIDLVDTLFDLWPDVDDGMGLDASVHALPERDILEDVVSICYQVSQMEEEARAIRFRMMLCEPHVFNDEETSKNHALFILTFSEPRPFNEYELTKLAPSVEYYHSLIGVRYSDVEGLQIWGVIHTGSKWSDTIHGGSQTAVPLPPSLVLNVVGSGRITVCHGLTILAQLSGGNIISPSLNVFQSQWLQKRFEKVQERLFARHRKNLHYNPAKWAVIDPAFVANLYQEYFKHVISTIRRSGHGGMLISLPMEKEGIFDGGLPLVSIKYRFDKSQERQRFRNLLLEIMASLANICGRLYGADYVAGWKDYVHLRDEGLAHLDEQIFEFARFVASLAAIDGAVVTTEAPDIIGFGGMIQGSYEMGQSVARALDPEGNKKQIERIEGVGSRHRALFYLCSKITDVLGISISQDGKVRAVAWNNNVVTSWDVIPIDFT